MALDKLLPIDEFRTQIEAQIARHPVTILTAETGAGKSTRVPYWLWLRGLRVHVTQPRRIAARSLAHYLARETGKALGGEIGYQTGLESKKSEATRLLYLTDGVKMAQEIRGSRAYDVLVLDEVHEWNLNQEVLVGLVKRGLDSGDLRRSGKRVVVMSATLSAARFSAFFEGAPIVDVPGRGFPVTTHFHSPLFLLPDAAQLVEEKRNVLVFQPGKQEIEEFSLNLRRMLDHEKQKAVILPFHSELSLREQARVFERHALPKVVVATDIAQTSLTIDDIDAVVDCGKKKEVRLVNGIEGLYPVDISSSECWQRAGRAGRVKPGVYILYSERDIGDRPEFSDPEIRRLNLETVILRMVLWGLDPQGFPFFHRPKHNLVMRAIESLKIFGALTPELAVTADGRRMAELPLSLRSSRLLLEAEAAGNRGRVVDHGRVVDRALKVIAIMESRGIAGKEYVPQGGPGPYASDLLSQLALWESARRHPGSISAKKAAMAREIYQELKKRLAVSPPGGGLGVKDERWIFRAILSSFVDAVYRKTDAGYCRGDEVRQLDRYSTVALLEKRPEMVVGLPFDLMVSRTSSQTGKVEETHFPLLTFCSEVSLSQLEELAPFSYRKEREAVVEEDRLVLRDRHFLGGSLLQVVEVRPDWDDAATRNRLAACALAWAEENRSRLPLAAEEERCRRWHSEAASLLSGIQPPFSRCWRDFLRRELEAHLRQQDILAFFSQHPGFRSVRLDRLIPAASLKELRGQGWPARVEAAGRSLPLRRIAGHPFIVAANADFEAISEDDALLPTGQSAGIILEGRRFRGWREAVACYNESLKKEIFRKKWFFDRKPARLQDLVEISFPVSFLGGRGKEQAPFEFFSAPMLEGGQVFLIHFSSLPEAEAYVASSRPAWEAAKRNFQKEKLDSLFRGKGWRVK